MSKVPVRRKQKRKKMEMVPEERRGKQWCSEISSGCPSCLGRDGFCRSLKNHCKDKPKEAALSLSTVVYPVGQAALQEPQISHMHCPRMEKSYSDVFQICTDRVWMMKHFSFVNV